MAITSEPHRRDPGTTRERLLRAALELYGTTGFAATTTPELARRAGIAEGTIYRHFKSKEALLNAVFQGVQGWMLKLCKEQAADREITAKERLMRIARALIDAAAKDPALVRLYLTPPVASLLDGKSSGAMAETAAALQHLVAMGKSDGRIKPGPAEMWAGVWLSVVGFAAERVARGEWTVEHPQIGTVLDAGWDAVASR